MSPDEFLFLLLVLFAFWLIRTKVFPDAEELPIPDGFKVLWRGYRTMLLDVECTVGIWGIYQSPNNKFHYIRYDYNRGKIGIIEEHTEHERLEYLPEKLLCVCPENIRKIFDINTPRNDKEKMELQLKELSVANAL